MSKLEQLINKLCPNGVEYKTLSDVLKIKNGKDYKQFKEGNIPVYGSGGIIAYIDVFVLNKPSVLIPRKGSIDKLYYVEKPFWTVDTIFYTEIYTDIVIPKFVFYYLQKEHLEKYNIAGGVPSLTQAVLNKISFPIPPLPVQEEIVRILDTFAELTTELTTELTMRKQQYEYYRESLLTFGEEVPIFQLNEVAQYSKDRINAIQVDKTTYIGVDNLLQDRQGKTDSNYVPTEGRLTKYEKNNILIGNIRPYLKKIWFSDTCGGTNGDVLVIQPIRDKLLPKYLYVLLCAEKFFNYNMQNVKGAKMPRGSKDAIMRYSIPVPPLEEQQRIVDILDRFDTLVNDIKTGLPAEIEARQRQYEYYRDKLLTFKK